MAKKYNCIKNGIPYFRKTKTIGYKLNGKPIKKEFYGDGERDCDKQIEEYIDKIKNGLNLSYENKTVAQIMYDWLFNVLYLSKNVKSSSFEKHEINYRLYIKKSPIGQIKINEISSKIIQTYYNKLFKEKKASSDKIFDINKTLRKFFNYCINEHILLNNPCSLNKIEIPGNADGNEDEADNEGNNIIVFSDEEIEILKNNIKYIDNINNTYNISYQLCLATGLREGELLGLKRKFVDLDNCIIKVRNTLKLVKVFSDEENYTRELKLILPKTKTSIRDIPFPKSLVPILQKYIIEQDLKYKKYGLAFNDDSLMFTTSSCAPICAVNYYRAWKRFLNRINIEHKKVHSIRDTYATTLIRKGAKILEVKELLGHSSLKTTEKYYIFVFPEDKANTIELINDFISL